MCNIIHWITAGPQRLIQKVFEGIGYAVGRLPFLFIFITLVICGICAGGLSRYSFIEDTPYLWTPIGSPYRESRLLTRAMFGRPPRRLTFFVEALGGKSFQDASVIRELNYVVNSIWTARSRDAATWEDVCVPLRHSGWSADCDLVSLLDYFGYGGPPGSPFGLPIASATLNTSEIKSAYRRGTDRAGRLLPLDRVLSSDSKVAVVIAYSQPAAPRAGANATATAAGTRGENPLADDATADADLAFRPAAWESYIEESVERWNEVRWSDVRVTAVTTQAEGDVAASARWPDLWIWLVAGGASALIVLLVLLRPHAVFSHTFLLVPLVATVALAGVAGVGAVSFFRYEMSQQVYLYGGMVLVFAAVFSCYYMVDCWFSAANEDLESMPCTPQQLVAMRLSRTYGYAGAALCTIYIPSIVGFAVGATTLVPALRTFSIFLSASLGALWGVLMFWFGAWVALDGHRSRTARRDIGCCFVPVDVSDDVFNLAVKQNIRMVKKVDPRFGVEVLQLPPMPRYASPAARSSWLRVPCLPFMGHSIPFDPAAPRWAAQFFGGPWASAVLHPLGMVIIIMAVIILMAGCGYGSYKIEPFFEGDYNTPSSSSLDDAYALRAQHFKVVDGETGVVSFYNGPLASFVSAAKEGRDLICVTPSPTSVSRFASAGAQGVLATSLMDLYQVEAVAKLPVDFWYFAFVRWAKQKDGAFVSQSVSGSRVVETVKPFEFDRLFAEWATAVLPNSTTYSSQLLTTTRAKLSACRGASLASTASWPSIMAVASQLPFTFNVDAHADSDVGVDTLKTLRGLFASGALPGVVFSTQDELYDGLTVWQYEIRRFGVIVAIAIAGSALVLLSHLVGVIYIIAAAAAVVAATSGPLWWLSDGFNPSTILLTITSTSYALHPSVAMFRAFMRARGVGRRARARAALARVGGVIFNAGVTIAAVAIPFCFAQTYPLRMLGNLTLVAVGASAVVALAVMPVLLSLVGPTRVRSTKPIVVAAPVIIPTASSPSSKSLLKMGAGGSPPQSPTGRQGRTPQPRHARMPPETTSPLSPHNTNVSNVAASPPTEGVQMRDVSTDASSRGPSATRGASAPRGASTLPAGPTNRPPATPTNQRSVPQGSAPLSHPPLLVGHDTFPDEVVTPAQQADPLSAAAAALADDFPPADAIEFASFDDAAGVALSANDNSGSS